MPLRVSAWLRCCFATTGILSLAACATPANNIGSNYVLSEASENGVVIASITSDVGSGSSELYYRKYQKINDGDGDYFSLRPFLQGDLFAVELSAGDYEIFRWEVRDGDARIGPGAPFSIRFHVSPGKPLYLGRYSFQRKFALPGGGNIQVYAGPNDAEVTVTNESDRDLNVLAMQYPGLTRIGIASIIERGQSYKYLGDGSKTTYVVSRPAPEPPYSIDR